MLSSKIQASDEDLPGSIRAVIPISGGGSIVMTGFPGLRSALDGSAFVDPEDCRDTIRGLSELDVKTLLVLVEREELEDLAFTVLEQVCKAFKIAIDYKSIEDFSVPDQGFSSWWKKHEADRKAVLSNGGTLAFSCQYGAGRSGMMASLCLIEQGMDPDDAMATVRAAFPPAVESTAQENWLRDHDAG